VIREHYDMVGKPSLYPAWSFGFHLCRWGYDNVTQTREVVTRMREANIPLEVQWNDIDYMDTYRSARLLFPSPTLSL
jgi:alpha-glucosidase